MEGVSQTPFHFFLLRSSQITPQNNVITYIRLGNSLANTSFQNSSFLFHGIQLLKCSCICLELNSKVSRRGRARTAKYKKVQKRVKLVQSWFDYRKLCSHYTGQIFVLTRNAVRYSVNTYPIRDYPVWFSCCHEMLSGIV